MRARAADDDRDRSGEVSGEVARSDNNRLCCFLHSLSPPLPPPPPPPPPLPPSTWGGNAPLRPRRTDLRHHFQRWPLRPPLSRRLRAREAAQVFFPRVTKEGDRMNCCRHADYRGRQEFNELSRSLSSVVKKGDDGRVHRKRCEIWIGW